jgi:hypothetical protein
MRKTSIIPALIFLCILGCQESQPKYGVEAHLEVKGERRQIWAVAPAVNLSGQHAVEAILQADIVFSQLQQIDNLTVIPVNRVVEVFASLRIDQVQSPEQAALVCDLLGCDALVVPTVTFYDPYVPPKFGASLQLFGKPGWYIRPGNVDPRELARRASPPPGESVPQADFLQAVGMFDAANGSTRDALYFYASGRHDPIGPLGAKEYVVSMDRFCGFAWFNLARDLIDQLDKRK